MNQVASHHATRRGPALRQPCVRIPFAWWAMQGCVGCTWSLRWVVTAGGICVPESVLRVLKAETAAWMPVQPPGRVEQETVGSPG